MDNGKYLQSIANGIYAANEVRNLLKAPNMRSDNTTGMVARSISVFGEVIKVIADYLPVENNQRGSNIKEMVNKSAAYGNTYSQLKQHLVSARQSRLNKDHLIETLAIVKPLLKDEPRTTVDKVLRIYEIIKA